MLSCVEKTGILGVEVEAGNIMLHWSSKLVFHQINCKRSSVKITLSSQTEACEQPPTNSGRGLSWWSSG